MAVRFTIGNLGRYLRFFRPRWGVRGSLFSAFAVIAGMAIVISAGAGLVLRHLGGTMLDLSGRDIPRLAASLQLAAQSASLASQGPALLAANNAEALNERTNKMKETQQVALAKLGEITALGADKAVVGARSATTPSTAWVRPPASGWRPPRCTTSNSMRCARRRPTALPSPTRR